MNGSPSELMVRRSTHERPQRLIRTAAWATIITMLLTGIILVMMLVM